MLFLGVYTFLLALFLRFLALRSLCVFDGPLGGDLAIEEHRDGRLPAVVLVAGAAGVGVVAGHFPVVVGKADTG